MFCTKVRGGGGRGGESKLILWEYGFKNFQKLRTTPNILIFWALQKAFFLPGVTCTSRGPGAPRHFNCMCLFVCMCVQEKRFHYATHRNQVCFCRQVATPHWSEHHRKLALLSQDRAATVQTYHPTTFSIFKFPFASIRIMPSQARETKDRSFNMQTVKVEGWASLHYILLSRPGLGEVAGSGAMSIVLASSSAVQWDQATAIYRKCFMFHPARSIA